MILHLILTNDITIAELSQILSEVASYTGEDSKVKGLATLRISLEDLKQFTESPSEQKAIIQEMLGTLAKYNVEAKTAEGN